MDAKRHPDDVPRTLNDLARYLAEAYRITASPWVLGDLIRRGALSASKVNSRWRSTASAYLRAMDPPARSTGSGQ